MKKTCRPIAKKTRFQIVQGVRSFFASDIVSHRANAPPANQAATHSANQACPTAVGDGFVAGIQNFQNCQGDYATHEKNQRRQQPTGGGQGEEIAIVFRACRAHLARPDLLRQWVLHVGQNFCGSWICSGVFISKKSGETPRPIVLWRCQNLRIPRIYHSTESSFLRI